MDDGRLPLPPAAVAAAYLLAGLGLLLPLAIVGAGFAGLVLAQRGLRTHGIAVLVLGVVCVVVGILSR